MTDQVRVRIAPSPTGPMHIGLARTALYNFLHARSCGGAFVLRIDDTDRVRSTVESLENIMAGLRWLGLDWDEGPEKGGDYGPYFQSERLGGYQERVTRLLETGHAYRCFATPEEVDEGRKVMLEKVGVAMYDRRYRDLPESEAKARAAAGEDHVIRFRIPEGKVTVHDLIKGDVEIDSSQIDDWVMVRRDGSPLYNLCSSLDDIDMRISHVIRGEEHFVNAVKQILLFRALGVEPPRFAHLPLILGTDGKKLSKRKAQVNLLDYAEQGYPAEALVNFFALLGWSYDGATEVFDLDQAIEHFSLSKLGKSGSIFDEEKMTWMCGVYIRDMDLDVLVTRTIPFWERAGVIESRALAETMRPWLVSIVACYQERARTYAELAAKTAFFFDVPIEYEDKARKNLRKKPEAATWLATWLESLTDAELPGADELEASARRVAGELGIGFGQLVHPLRAALTGSAAGAGLFDIVHCLGRALVEKRVCAAIEWLESLKPD